jgi:hypothetical protein
MAVLGEFKRALSSLTTYPIILAVAVLLAVVRAPPMLGLVGGPLLYGGGALLLFVFSPLAMGAMLVVSDNALREQPWNEDLGPRVTDRYLPLLGSNLLVGLLAIAVRLVVGFVLVLVFAVVVGGAVMSTIGTSGGGPASPDGLVAGLGVGTLAVVVLVPLVGTLVALSLDFLFHFHKPAAVLGDRGAVDSLKQSYGLVTSFPRVALGYYALQLAVGVALGAVALAILGTVGAAAIGAFGGGPLSGATGAVGSTVGSGSSGGGGLLVLAGILAVGYAVRSLTYALTLPFTVNVYQYLRYRSQQAE